MGKLRLNILWDGKDIENYKNTIEEYNTFFYLRERYRFELIQQFEFQGEDRTLDIDIKGADEIDWTKFEVPATVQELINEILSYTGAKREIEIVLNKIKSTSFSNRHNLSTLGQSAVNTYKKLKPGEYIYCPMLDQARRCDEVNHTLGKEVSAVSRLRDKDAQYRKKDGLDSAIRYLESDISGMFYALDDLKLK